MSVLVYEVSKKVYSQHKVGDLFMWVHDGKKFYRNKVFLKYCNPRENKWYIQTSGKKFYK
jgi:hypothetical protein